MHDIIEHYGKVIVALAGVLAAVLLTVAVLAIVLTAPLGAFAIDLSYRKLLTKSK